MRPRLLHTLFGLMVLLCLAATHRQAQAYGLAQKVQSVQWCVASSSSGPFTFCAASASASFDAWFATQQKPATATERWTYTGKTCTGPYGNSPTRQSPCTSMEKYEYYNAGSGTWSVGYNRTGPSATIWERAALACPGMSNEIDGKCECQVGTKPSSNGLECVPYQCPGGESYTKMTQPDVEVQTVGSVCLGGCEAQPDAFSANAGKLYAHWPFRYSGQACGGDKAPSGIKETGDGNYKELPSTCGRGKCPGSINGTAVCVQCSNSVTPPTKETAPAPVPADQPGVDGVKGAASKDTKTSCTATQCTTVTNYYNDQGNKVGEKVQDKPKESFCQENPQLSICKDGKWAGSCEAGYSCDGDPIQCAMARKQHESACKLFQEPSDQLKATVESLKGTGMAQGAFDESVSVSAGFTPMPSAGCAVVDFPASFGVFTVNVPIGTMLCPHLSTIRAVLSAFGALYFVMIVFVRGD